MKRSPLSEYLRDAHDHAEQALRVKLYFALGIISGIILGAVVVKLLG